MAYETIIVDNRDFVTTITLNRPERLNALNLQLANELFDALHEKDQDDDTRVFIITGAGRGFSSGADQRGGGPSEPRASNAPGLAERMFQCFNDVEKPIIAAINGWAVGGGCTMTLLCDLRIASEEARFLLPFTRLGIHAELGSTYTLPRLIGQGKASEMILLSKTVEAREALEIGLVNQVVPADQLAQVSWETATAIAGFSPMSVRVNKQGLKQGLQSDIETQLRYETLALSVLGKAEDTQEARAAAREGRDPVFKGR